MPSGAVFQAGESDFAWRLPLAWLQRKQFVSIVPRYLIYMLNRARYSCAGAESPWDVQITDNRSELMVDRCPQNGTSFFSPFFFFFLLVEISLSLASWLASVAFAVPPLEDEEDDACAGDCPW